MYRILVTWVAKLTIRINRMFGTGGSALPGLIIEKLSPQYLAKTSRYLKNGVVLITGTNGKTTTTKLLAGILENANQKVVVNRSGSNMSRGIAAALAEQSNWLGRPRGDVGLFEVDEAFVPNVAKQLKPKAIIVLNLLRDQLDRYGELDRTASLINQGLRHTSMAVLNADDPLVKALAEGRDKTRVAYFGAVAKLQNELPDDASLLQKTTRGLEELLPNFRHLRVLLTSCQPLHEGQKIHLKANGKSYEAALQLSGVYNAYNAIAAITAADVLKIDLTHATQSLASISPAFGRSEEIDSHGKTLQLLLVKNPAGFNQVLKTFLNTNSGLPILFAINDNFADGRDVSWLWDVDFELLHSKKPHVLVTGLRAYDLALRLKYAGVESTVEPDPQTALRTLEHNLKAGETGYIVPTYTAMLKLRGLLAKKSAVEEIWK